MIFVPPPEDSSRSWLTFGVDPSTGVELRVGVVGGFDLSSTLDAAPNSDPNVEPAATLETTGLNFNGMSTGVTLPEVGLYGNCVSLR